MDAVHSRTSVDSHSWQSTKLTEHVSKRPVAHKFVGKRQRHDEHADEQIADGQRRNKPVLHAFQTTVGGDGDDDKAVAEHDSDDDDRYGDSG